MILYEDTRAPNPRRVRIFLAEKAMDVPRRAVDIMALEHHKPEHLAHNPLGRVPYLELDDGTIIAETVAICRYFEALQPEPALFGSSPVEQCVVEMWQRRMEFNFLGCVAAVFRHSHPKMAPLETPQIKAWSEANVPRVEWMLDFLDTQLADRQFVAGDAFSIADITALCAADFMKVARFSIGDHRTNLKRWHEDVSARPGSVA